MKNSYYVFRSELLVKVSTFVEVLSNFISPKLIELALNDTLNLLEYPFRHRGIVFPDLHTILKLAIILVSTNPGIKVILTAKLILAGICPLSGVNPKNCSSNYPFPLSLSM